MTELGGKGGRATASFAQAFTTRHFGHLPKEAMDALALSFEDRCAVDAEKAADWASCLGSIFLEDYDGTKLSIDDWKELRDILSENAGEMDMGLLSYAMGLIMEHKAL